MKNAMLYPQKNTLKVKYLAALFALMAVSISTMMAQESALFIGVNGGANRSYFKQTDDLASLYTTNSAVTGVNTGLSAGIQLNHFTLTTGVQYVQKGGIYATDNYNDNQGTAFFSAKEKLHYISVPLLVGYQKPLGDHLGLTLAMGPSFNFGLAGQLEESTEYFGLDDIETTYHTVYFGDGVNEDYKKMQMGFQISPGLYVKLNSRSRINLNLNWDSGTEDAFNERYKEANVFFDEFRGKQFTRSTMLTVGYEYRFAIQDKY